MKKLKRFLFVIIAIIPILCVSCDNDEQGEEVTKIVESRTSQDLMSDLYLACDGDVESLARMLQIAPSSIEKIRKGETEATADFEKKIKSVAVFYFQNDRIFSKLQSILDPEYGWYDSVLNFHSHHPWIFWPINILLLLILAFVSVSFAIWPILIEMAIYIIAWIASLICSPYKMEYVMNNLWLYVALCAIFIIGILVIVIIRILNNHPSSKSKMSYREKESKELKKKIDDKLKQHDSLLAKLKEELVNRYRDMPKTYTNLTRINNPELHFTLSEYFGLSREENILYCRRYTRTFGSDSFFIITEKGFGYAPYRKPEDFLLFEDVSELIKADDLNEIMFINNHDETVFCVDADDFIYGCTSDELIKEINRFLSQYQSPLDIYLDAGFEALDRKLTPILSDIIDIIQHIGNYTERWEELFLLQAGYKYVLAEDGVDVKHNAREAFDNITDIEKSWQDKKNSTIYCACELLRAKIMLLEEEADHMEIKKILDAVAGNAENPNIKDEANLIRRQLKL